MLQAPYESIIGLMIVLFCLTGDLSGNYKCYRPQYESIIGLMIVLFCLFDWRSLREL